MIEGFLLGVIVTASWVSGAFFYRFWRQSRDELFLAFSVAFLIEGCNRFAFLFMDRPSEGHALSYAIRLCSYLLILAAIVRKNRK